MKTPMTDITKLLLFGLLTVSSCQKLEVAPEPVIQSPPPPPPADSIESQSPFSTSAEGWVINGDYQNGGFAPAKYSPTGGVIDGYIYGVDAVEGGTWYFVAPPSYLGNKPVYYNCTLMFSLFQHSAMKEQYKNADIILQNGRQRIVYLLSQYPDTTWTHYKVKINEKAGWYKGNYEDGIPATKADIDSVLKNVTAFLIRGEYESGPDTGGLDYLYIYK